MVIPNPGMGAPFSNVRSWVARHPYWTLTALTLLIFGPFLAKPFNIDDPLFILAAHQIQAHPLDPYGFNVDWGWQPLPMWRVTENPPLACYYVALAAALAGWSEPALHGAMLLPALAAILGMYRLARHFCGQPMLAALVMLFTPGFLVSGLTVMCDMPMAACWIWAVIFWVEGGGQNQWWKLFIAGGLIALAELTKYYGACLVPLLAAYSIAGKHPPQRWAPCLLAPLGALMLYNLAGKALYGESLLTMVANHSLFYRGFAGFTKAESALLTLVFAGGSAGAATIFAPLLWRGRTLGAWLGVAGVVTAVVMLRGSFWSHYQLVAREERIYIVLQMVLWAAGGLLLLWLAALDWWRRRDAAALLLGGWVLGTLAFVAFFNWSVNARTLLPCAPPIGILVARRFELAGVLQGGVWLRKVWICLLASLALALAVSQGDYLMAVAIRQNARQVGDEFKNQPGHLWFEGHWGFQYYLNAAGAKPLNFMKLNLQVGDIIAVPSNNADVSPPPADKAGLATVYTFRGPGVVTTCNETIGAGFYSCFFGPLPFAFGSVPPETASIYTMKPTP